MTVILFSNFLSFNSRLILFCFLSAFLLGVRHAKLPHFKLEKIPPDDRI